MVTNIETIVVVPCYNEASRLDTDAFRNFLSGHPDVAFCFVNDGSDDDTESLLREIAHEFPERVIVETLVHNSGKAEAVRRGILFALDHWPNAAFCGFWDADLATPLEEIPKFVHRLHTENGVAAIGSRVDVGIRRPLVRRLPSAVIHAILSVVTRLPWRDTQCGAKLFTASLAARIFKLPFLTRWLFDVELLSRIPRSSRKEVLEHHLPCWRDIEGSKLRGRDALRIFSELCILFKAIKGDILVRRI